MTNFKPVGSTVAATVGAVAGGGGEIIRETHHGEKLDGAKIGTHAAIGAAALFVAATASQKIPVGEKSLWESGMSLGYRAVGKTYVPDSVKAAAVAAYKSASRVASADLSKVLPDSFMTDMMTLARSGKDTSQAINAQLAQHLGDDGAKAYGALIRREVAKTASAPNPDNVPIEQISAKLAIRMRASLEKVANSALANSASR